MDALEGRRAALLRLAEHNEEPPAPAAGPNGQAAPAANQLPGFPAIQVHI